MKRICAFCNDELSSDAQDNDKISHGVCTSCYNHIKASMGVDIGEYINMLDHPVVLVDEDMQILCANQEINKISQNEATSAIGHLGGEVFECDYARCPGGCGKSTHCSGCVIRNSVKETYQTGKSVDKRPATIEKEIQGNCVPVNIFISTRKTGDVVLLQVEESQENVSSQDCDSDL